MRPVLGGRQPLVGVAIACTHCSKTGTPTMSLPSVPVWCAQRGQSWQKVLLPHCPGLGHNTREKQAWRFIPEPFCFCDLLYFTFPARQDEKQIPPKYDERGYS